MIGTVSEGGDVLSVVVRLMFSWGPTTVHGGKCRCGEYVFTLGACDRTEFIHTY